jgi:hypothetical protein
MKLISSKYFPGPFLAAFIDNGVLMFKTLFVVLFVLVSPYSGFAQNRCIDIYRSPKMPTLSKQILDEKLFAVHITDYLPKNGILRTTTDNRARFATTLHFSLGGPVIAHEGGSWDHKKYAIMVPFKTLKPQLLNIFAQDTFIVGDLVLPSNAILLVPSGETAKIDFPGKVLSYDSQAGIIQGVKNQLEKDKTIVLESTGDSLTDKTFLNGKVINEKIFFKDYFSENTKLTNELHAKTVFGVIDVKGFQIFKDWYYHGRPLELNLTYLKYHHLVLQELLQVATEKVSQMKLPPMARGSYDEGVQSFQELLNILEVEIRIQEKFKKSFLASGSVLRKEILSRKSNSENLESFVTEIMGSLPEAKPPTKGTDIFLLQTFNDFKDLGFERFKYLVQQHGEKNSVDPFEIESLILRKAIDSAKSDRSYMEIAIEQFEKTSLITPSWGYQRIKGYLRSITAPSDLNRFFKNERIRELYQ